MKLLCFTLLLLFSLKGQSFDGGYGLGFNLGVAQLHHTKGGVTGTAWSFQANYEVDDFLSIFGQAGQERGVKGDDSIKHNLFGGGVLLMPLSFIEIKAGVSLNSWEAKLDSKKIEKEGVSPLVGAYLVQSAPGMSYGTGISASRTGDFQSISLAVFLRAEMQ